MPTDKIVLLPGESSILVNCAPVVEENALLVELSYMNFLKRPGFLFDVSRTSKPSVLVAEAMDAGVNVISGINIAANSDVFWAKWAFGVDLDLNSYRKDFESSLLSISRPSLVTKNVTPAYPICKTKRGSSCQPSRRH